MGHSQMRIVKAALAVFFAPVARQVRRLRRRRKPQRASMRFTEAGSLPVRLPQKDSADAASSTGGETKPPCAIAQVQLEEKTRKLVVSVEFRLDDAATPDRLNGTMVLPFGLAVTKLFSVKSGNMRLQEVQVSTCLPVGCIVSFTPFIELVSALKAEQTLTIEAPDLQGRIVSFSCRAKVFQALKRLGEVR